MCWSAAGFWTTAIPSTPEQVDATNPLGLRRSAYGSLMARLMKDSMHNYWHAGRMESPAAHNAAGAAGGPAHDPAHAHNHDPNHKNPPEGAASENASGHFESRLEQVSEWVSLLEEHRTTPTSRLNLSPAHRRYLEGTANWHLKLAYRLDPGDAALYEILHFTAMSRAPSAEAAQRVAESLAASTIAHALSPQGGLSSALTGAGAAINLLNNELQTGGGIAVTREEMLRHWELLTKCLARYWQLRAEAGAEGWWEAIPPTRQKEIGAYAALVQRIAGTIGRKLTALEVLKP
jgi:hypothetical protein